jgi:hypothetical protein
MFERINIEVHVQIGPIQMVLVQELHVQNGVYPGIAEPGVLRVGEKVLLPIDVKPQAMRGDVEHLNL